MKEASPDTLPEAHSSSASLPDLPSEQQITAQVTMALSALDSRYKENIAAYGEKLHHTIQTIETQKIRLASLQKEQAPHHAALSRTEKEIDYALRLLERLTEQFIQQCLVITDLEATLGHAASSQENRAPIQARYRTLHALKEEIEALELSLLNHELERENILLTLEPLTHETDALEQKIAQLESQKHYIESSHLHRLSQVTPPLQTSAEHPATDTGVYTS